MRKEKKKINRRIWGTIARVNFHRPLSCESGEKDGTMEESEEEKKVYWFPFLFFSRSRPFRKIIIHGGFDRRVDRRSLIRIELDWPALSTPETVEHDPTSYNERTFMCMCVWPCGRVYARPTCVYSRVCVRAHVTARLGYSYRNKPLYGLLIMPYGSMFYGHIMSTRPFSCAILLFS